MPIAVIVMVDVLEHHTVCLSLYMSRCLWILSLFVNPVGQFLRNLL